MINNMQKRIKFWWMVMGLASINLSAFGVEPTRGVLILASAEGDVRFEDGAGIPAKDVKPGEPISPSYYVITGAGAKAIGLLSNGTLLTLDENTRMKVGTFEQEPFKDDGRKVSELSEEPSKSKVILELDMGSLILKTKKLNKDSSLNINSPLGFAGIRGTEFQMASNPGQGVQLDVTESTVEFTPPGGGPPIAVSEGSGMSAPPGGAPTLRPVNPSVAQKIQVSNEVAAEATQDVSLGEVSAAMEQVAAESESDSSNDSASEESESTEESSEGDSQEDGSGTDSPDEPVDEVENGSEGAPVEAIENTPVEVGDPQASALENNAELAQARKTGRFDAQTKELAKFGLLEDQTFRFYELSVEARTKLLLEERKVVRRLLSLEEFTKERADSFFDYRPQTRDLILGLENEVMLTLLDQGIEEVLLEESLTKMNIDFSRTNRVPTNKPGDSLSVRARSLSERLMESGNGEVLEELSEMANGVWTEELIRLGEVADSLLGDYRIEESSVIDPLDVSEVMGNPFYQEVTALYDQLLWDGLISGGAMVVGGKNLIVSDNVKALGPYFSDGGKELIVVASQSLDLDGDFQWEAPTDRNTRLVAMSAGTLSVSPGSALTSVTSDLVLAARQNLLLSQVSLDAAREVVIRGYRDVTLRDVSIGADLLTTIKARRDLDVDGLVFKRDVSRIVMEATTLRLKNINFPAASQVRLNSLHGPIDGKYPNFGTAIPAAQQIGRVNFIENVRSGGNLLKDRPTFDLHGKNLQIGKIARP